MRTKNKKLMHYGKIKHATENDEEKNNTNFQQSMFVTGGQALGISYTAHTTLVFHNNLDNDARMQVYICTYLGGWEAK